MEIVCQTQDPDDRKKYYIPPAVDDAFALYIEDYKMIEYGKGNNGYYKCNRHQYSVSGCYCQHSKRHKKQDGKKEANSESTLVHLAEQRKFWSNIMPNFSKREKQKH